MEKTRIDFITDLLTSSRLKAADKERVLLLAANELKNDGLQFDKIWQEIELLKNGKLQDDQELVKDIKETENRSQSVNLVDADRTDKKHSPKDVADFMSLFNQRDGLKYLTHDFDEEGDFVIEDFLKTAKETFVRQTGIGGPLSIPGNLWQIVNRFAFTENPSWGPDYVNKEGFSSNTWIQWSKTNKLHPIRNESFKIYIDKFRDLTRIQAPKLKGLVQEVLDRVLGEAISEYQIDLHKLELADFYTNISPFERALRAIILEIKKASDSKKITISYDRSVDGDYFVRKLIITQHDSFPAKELKLILKEWFKDKGAMGGIRNNLIGYCHWSIETKIEGKASRINILKDNETPVYEEVTQEEILGFKHVLTFYYK